VGIRLVCLTVAAARLAETTRPWCSATVYRVVPEGLGQHSARPSRSDGGKISKCPAAAQSLGVSGPRVAAVFRVLTSAAAVPYPGLIGYNSSRMWDKFPPSLLAHTSGSCSGRELGTTADVPLSESPEDYCGERHMV
jgi:hypothetical protein